MTTPQISLAMLARAAYRLPERPAADNRAQFQPELARATHDASAAVRIELSLAGRNALLELQEIGRSSPSASFASVAAAGDVLPDAYREPGSLLNLTI